MLLFKLAIGRWAVDKRRKLDTDHALALARNDHKRAAEILDEIRTLEAQRTWPFKDPIFYLAITVVFAFLIWPMAVHMKKLPEAVTKWTNVPPFIQKICQKTTRAIYFGSVDR